MDRFSKDFFASGPTLFLQLFLVSLGTRVTFLWYGQNGVHPIRILLGAEDWKSPKRRLNAMSISFIFRILYVVVRLECVCAKVAIENSAYFVLLRNKYTNSSSFSDILSKAGSDALSTFGIGCMWDVGRVAFGARTAAWMLLSGRFPVDSASEVVLVFLLRF